MTSAPTVIPGRASAITPTTIATRPRKTGDHQCSASNSGMVFPFSALGLVSAFPLRWEMFEHFFHGLLHLLLVFFRLVAQGIVRYAAPDQLFRRRVKDIDYESADRLIINGCSRCAEPSESPPP